MRKSHGVLLVTVFLLASLFIICLSFFIQDSECIDSVRFVVTPMQGVAESVSLYNHGDAYYAFLPAYAQWDDMRLEYRSGCTIYLNDTPYTSESALSDLEFDRPYSMRITNFVGMTVFDGQLFFKKAGNIPALSIHLTDGTVSDLAVSKEVSKTGFASLINPDSSIAYSGNIKEIHGRGNSTWGQAKKSYKLILPQEADLLGMGAATNWVLLSNSFDESGLRNKLAYDFAKELGVSSAIDSEYIDLYIDDVYYGLYLLAESVEVGPERVDISNLYGQTQSLNQAPLSSYSPIQLTESDHVSKGFAIPNNPSDISGGYLLQLEHHRDQFLIEESIFQTNLLDVVVASPKYASSQQISYISSHMQQLENQICHGDLSGIDVPSFAKYYMIHELFASGDPSSCYYYKNSDTTDGKLYAGPIWDFDMSIGNAWLATNIPANVLYYNFTNWYDILCENEQFRQVLQNLYEAELKPELFQRISLELGQYKNLISQSFDMDRLRWSNVPAPNNFAVESQKHFDTVDEHVEDILRYMSERLTFLDKVWTDDHYYYSVKFASSDVPHGSFTYTFRAGDECTADPQPVISAELESSYIFLGWYDENGEQYVPNSTLDQSKTYYSQWQKVTASVPENSIAAESTSATPGLLQRLLGPNKYLYCALGAMLLFITFFIVTDIRRSRK